MNIFVIGDAPSFEELKDKFSQNETVSLQHGTQEQALQSNSAVLLDLNLDENPQRLKEYVSLKQDQWLIVGAVKCQLLSAVAECGEEIKCHLAGLNTLPSFLNRKLWEMSFLKEEDQTLFSEKLGLLGVELKAVKDRVGMVTPRIILMIINEAFYTVQEGTAEKADIDQAMKLGTNYPNGPFEWAEKIGIQHVYKTLKALQEDTQDPRYKICPLLKTEYLKSF